MGVLEREVVMVAVIVFGTHQAILGSDSGFVPILRVKREGRNE